jgi:hypothetical protein
VLKRQVIFLGGKVSYHRMVEQLKTLIQPSKYVHIITQAMFLQGFVLLDKYTEYYWHLTNLENGIIKK